MYSPTAPNMIHIVKGCAEAYPTQFADCHRPDRGERAWTFIEIVASKLHYEYDQRFGLNAKRGNPADRSMDAVSYLAAASPAGGVEIIDVVGSAGTDQARPAWNDVTQETIDKGDVGGFIRPRRLSEILDGDGVDVIDPGHGGGDPVTPPPPDPAILERLAQLEALCRVTASGIGQVARQVSDMQLRQEELFASQTKRLFGTLVEENGLTYPGVAEEAVSKLYERSGSDPLKVKLSGRLGGLL